MAKTKRYSIMVSTTDFDSVGIGSIPIIAVSFFFKSPGCGGSIPPRGVSRWQNKAMYVACLQVARNPLFVIQVVCICEVQILTRDI